MEESEILKALGCLQYSDRRKIIKLLCKTNESLSYAEIKKYFGKRYNDGILWGHLKGLIREGLIVNEKMLKKSTTATKKTRYSFYKLTQKGEKVSAILVLLENILNLSERNILKLNNNYTPFFI